MNGVRFSNLLKFRFLSRPAFSPDGTKVAYVVSTPNLGTDGYDCDLWVYDFETGRNVQVSRGHSERFFTWSRDGRELIYASSRAGGAKGQTSVFAQPIEGFARPLFTVPRKITSVTDLGGGRYLVTAIYKPPFPNPEGADYMVFDELPIMANGSGFLCQKRTAVAIYDTAGGALSRLTPLKLDVTKMHVSEDGSRALLVGVEFSDVKPFTNNVYELRIASNTLTCLSEGLKFTFKDVGWWNERIVVSGNDQKTGGVNQNSKFYELLDGKLTCLSPDLDSSLHSAVGSDCRYNSVDQTGYFAEDGDRIIFCGTDAGRSHLYALDEKGVVTPVTTDYPEVVDNWCWKDGRAVMVGFRGLQLQELYYLDEGKVTQLTQLNEEGLKNRDLSAPQYLSCTNDGWRIDGWYIKPLDFQEGEKYPAILDIHGGPKSAYGANYYHEMQCWAAQGYVVLFCNPRGGDGRGYEFSDIRGFYGDKDYRDIMAFVKNCIEKLPFIDATRVGVTGGSYGGFMTNWIIGHTDFFKAACAQRPISNWVSKFGSCDIGYYYMPDQHGPFPWVDATQAWDESPLKYAANVKTPLLLIQAQEDYRCERDQSFQMFTALKVLGVECRMCLFNGENHEMSRSGRPRNRLARLREITSWFDAHLKG